MTEPSCMRCNSANVKWRAQIISNGTRQIAPYCLDCNRWAETPPRWIPHEIVNIELFNHGKVIGNIPVVADYSNASNCVICGQPGEYHHWAPQALSEPFGEDWNNWPGVHLCIRHHLQWHKIVTPQLSQKK